jgi:type II secretory pathway component PulC
LKIAVFLFWASVSFGKPDGYVLDRINKSSQLYKKGLRDGDTILTINGTAITSDNAISLLKSLNGSTSVLIMYENNKGVLSEIILSDRE